MNFHVTAIPAEFPAPKSGTDFRSAELVGMFDEGVRQIQAGTAWRTTPPGAEFGEAPLKRAGTCLEAQPRDEGAILVPPGPPPGSGAK